MNRQAPFSALAYTCLVRACLMGTCLMGLAACDHTPPSLEPLPALSGRAGAASPRVSGMVEESQRAQPAPAIAPGSRTAITPRLPAGQAQGGDVSLNFVDTDIREIARQVLGGLLHLNYTIDPSVRGTATLETKQPIARADLLPTLETLLNQNGATLLQRGSLYQVVPSTVALTQPTVGGEATSGSQVVALRYTSAKDLAKVLQPFIGTGARLVPDPARNALLLTGDPGARATLESLIRAFDVDVLAGHSFALFPVSSGDPGKVAGELQKVFQTEGDGALAGVVRVIPMERVNAVLVVSPEARYIDDARRLFDLVDQARRVTARNWHVYYVQNGQSTDLARLLQNAFGLKTEAEPANANATAPGQEPAQISGGTESRGAAGGGFGGIGGTGGTNPQPPGGSSGFGGGGASAPGGGGMGMESAASGPASEQLSPPEPGGGGMAGPINSLRIFANRRNNALLIYATAEEESTIEGLLHKIDIVPLQVRIDATIAEVTLNDALNYGTQFYFQDGGLNGLLTKSPTGAKTLTGNFPGFVLSKGTSAVHFAISALQEVTDVRVLSSPQLLVLDNEAARLQVGDTVPYLTQSAQSTVTSTAPIINSVDYHETGVILQIVPHVNSGGLVTLDISQEVSAVAATTTSTINSPTFSERKVRSHVVIQDGQTVGLAGLISDDTTRGNSGVPYLKDIPLLGSLFGTQNNTRARTELLVLITPHVMQDQRDARALTEDMREKLLHAGLVPQQLEALPVSGSANPNGVLSQ